MLPGRSPLPTANTKYAGDAIEALLERTRELGAESEDLEVNIVGGGNVLREGDIPDKVIESVLGYLKESNLRLRGMRVGGFDRRSAFLDTTTGNVYYTEGSNTTTRLLEHVEHV
jgi:chemotaxis receptor (MCP) glutamine deamidase CheD